MIVYADSVAIFTALAVLTGSSVCFWLGLILATFGLLYQIGRIIERARKLDKEK